MKTDDIEKTIAKIKTLPELEPPLSLLDSVMSQVAQSQNGWLKRCFAFIVTPHTVSLRPISLAVTASLLFMLGYFIPLDQKGNPSLNNQPVRHNSILKTTQSAEASYLIGRGFMAAGLVKEAMPLLKQAAIDVPDNPDYALWAGLSFAANDMHVEERSSYRKAIDSWPDDPVFLLNIGHSFLEERKYDEALNYYERVLSLNSTEKTALYNKGLIFQLQGKKSDEIATWKTYLENYHYGVKSFRAVQHLNNLNDFTFRTYYIGTLKIILNHNELQNFSSQKSISYNGKKLVRYLQKYPSLHLDIVTYNEKSATRARKKAIDLKKYIATALGDSAKNRIQISWFAKAENIQTQYGSTQLSESVLIFARNTHQPQQETSI